MAKVFLSEWDRTKSRAIDRTVSWAQGEKKRLKITDENLASEYGISRSAWSRKLRERSLDFEDFVYLVYRFRPDKDTLRYIVGD